jgi:hypothetical protein
MKLRITLALWLSTAVSVVSAAAAEPFGVRLMRSDSLAGWDHGATPTGWTIARGRLTGNAAATPLLSGFSFGDFELHLQWSVAPAAHWRILFPEVPRGEGLTLTLCEGEGCGRLAEGGKELAAGTKVGSLGSRMHAATLRRRGGKLSVVVDGRPIHETGLAADRRFGLGLAVAGGEAMLEDLRVQEPAGAAIFQGSDLTGWWTPAGLSDWKAERGELVLTPHSGNYIRTEKSYGNFTLTVRYLAKKGCNSGIGIRTPKPGWPSGDGMELQILDDPPSATIDKGTTMAIYGNVPPFARTDRSEQWNDVVVKADGWMITAWMNGELVQQCNTLDHPELKHRNLQGWIGFQDHGSWIRFRDVRVLEAPDGPGLDAWLRPKPQRAAAAIVDRLMNPERLSVGDGIRSGVVAFQQKTKSKNEQVVARLAGPGAVVRIAQRRPEGRLAFYFDGESRPRIECKAGDLYKHVPAVAEDSAPILTCLTYKESLKVVLREAKQSEIRVDYVTFPRQYELASFVDCESGFPRGWLSALSYRHSQGSWGGHREFDLAPRAACPKKNLRPGETAPLIHVAGTGVVQWIKLQANLELLESSDLWLQAVVDGAPAVTAPARFWYPHLAGQGNTYGFVMVDRVGPTVRLAMPYTRDFRMEAMNRGTRPIRGVGMTISYEPATANNKEEITRRLHLRGIYQGPGHATDELIRQAGCGRWVGWITESAGGDPPRVESLVVDGVPVSGWNASKGEMFLGNGGEFRASLSGRHGNLAWRYLWLAPVEFRESIVLKANGKNLGGRLALFYVKK